MSNVTVNGCVDDKKRILTVDTGASHSIVRSDLVKKKNKTTGRGKVTYCGWRRYSSCRRSNM